MTTPSARRHDGIALCLSGGGFRASLFHLGALRRLHGLSVLHRLEAISAVSGGSIVAGYVATALRETGRDPREGFVNWNPPHPAALPPELDLARAPAPPSGTPLPERTYDPLSPGPPRTAPVHPLRHPPYPWGELGVHTGGCRAGYSGAVVAFPN